MALKYGFLKCKIVSDTTLKSTKRRNEIQYHFTIIFLAAIFPLLLASI